MMKLFKLEIEGDFLNMAENIYNQSVANIKLNGEKTGSFLIRLEARQ